MRISVAAAKGRLFMPKWPFLGTQVVVMLIFIVLGIRAAKRFPAEAVQAA
jgi:hypothetical protein